MKKMMSSLVAAALTGMIMIMPMLTCYFIFHQPKMPDEINDFRKYDK